MWAGVVPQQPPISRAPAAIHSAAAAAKRCGVTDALRWKPVVSSGSPRFA